MPDSLLHNALRSRLSEPAGRPHPGSAVAQHGWTVILEPRDRGYVEARSRAGVLEQATRRTCCINRAGERLAREALVHDSFELRVTAAHIIRSRTWRRTHDRSTAARSGQKTSSRWRVEKQRNSPLRRPGAPHRHPAGERPSVVYEQAASGTTDRRCHSRRDGFHGVAETPFL